VAHDVTARYSGPLPRSRELRLRRLRLPDGSLLDEALVVVFDEGDSFTGEASAEWHLHGSLAVQRQALAALAAEPGCRLSLLGEAECGRLRALAARAQCGAPSCAGSPDATPRL